jgi:uncharacterized protein (TIGR02217 family)
MAFWLADRRDGQDFSWLQRFDPRFWTIDFPRPMIAALVTPAPDALRVEATFQREGDLAGIIWASKDTLDHPLLAYAEDRDYARTTLSFRWRSGGVIALDAVNGPTLTIEGRDASGAARSWYVRLWNYAAGTPEDAEIVLPFSALRSGWLADGEAVWPGDIDRMFISLVAPGHVPASTAALAAPAGGWAEMTAIRCDGDRAMLRLGDVIVPPHGLAIATAYDDCTNQAPARLVRSALQLGYRGSLLHYVGMSHFMRLAAQPDDTFLVPGPTDPLAGPARTWHAAFFAEAHAAGFAPIASISFELLAQHCPQGWQQRAYDGAAARTGWVPPPALLSPASAPGMAWLQASAAAFAALLRDAGAAVRVQIGEPWWWVMADGRPCLYDDAARAVLGGSPVEIADLKAPLDSTQTALLDAAGALLASATFAVRDAVRAGVSPEPAEVVLLAFLPTVLDPAMPEARRANLPAGWAAPAFDALQLEDYDWLTAGADALRRGGYAAADARLGYPTEQQDYLAGFATLPGDLDQWRRIDAGAAEAASRGARERFVWALPQVCRDGFTAIAEPEEDMQAFDDIAYPFALGLDAGVTAEFSTTVATTASGFEHRSSLWSDARLHFDVGPGIRSEAELGDLIAFFRARRGAARGFRLRDPTDFSSHGMTGTPTAIDQLIGLGDGVTTRFALVKHYGPADDAQQRRITRPVAGSVVVSLDGLTAGGWTVDGLGSIEFAAPPAAGVAVRAGFLFDVPVRFAEDRLAVSGAAFAAGEAPSVPLIELREAA